MIAVFLVEQRVADGVTAEGIVESHKRDGFIDLADSRIVACRVYPEGPKQLNAELAG